MLKLVAENRDQVGTLHIMDNDPEQFALLKSIVQP